MNHATYEGYPGDGVVSPEDPLSDASWAHGSHYGSKTTVADGTDYGRIVRVSCRSCRFDMEA